MSETDKWARFASANPRRARAGDYDVGYGRPPKQSQFKPGQSGNPRGRRSGGLNRGTLLKFIFSQRFPIRQNGRLRNLSAMEAVTLKLLEKALKGDTKAYELLRRDYDSYLRQEKVVRQSRKITSRMSPEEAAACYAEALRREQSSDDD